MARRRYIGPRRYANDVLHPLPNVLPLGAAAVEYSPTIAHILVQPTPPPPPPKRSTIGPRGRTVPVARTRLAMGDDITTPTLEDPIARIDANVRVILQRQEQEQQQRKFALIIAGASALFAAAKLGLIAFPMIKSRFRPGE